jgi:sentrin-specific protease 1
VFSKDLIIVPIHCHGNHWTLAVINMRQTRFEYYDSLRGPPGMVLTNLRRWLEDESLNKKQVPLDTSGWTEVVWKQGQTPQQRNCYDCGIFMSRTADWLARDAVLSFTQEDMEHLRRLTVLEIKNASLVP